MHRQENNLGLTQDDIKQLVQGARDNSRVAGLTHRFYRYPARFSPSFVRGVIEAFTKPGDWVIDPFVGGGTTLVEAMALGRNAIGIDISTLSSFLSKAKTQILSNEDVTAYKRWCAKIDSSIGMQKPGKRNQSYAELGYYRNLEDKEFWRLRKAIEQILFTVSKIRRQQAQTLARCAVLNTAQWALDSRKTRPCINSFKSKMKKLSSEMLTASLEFRKNVESTNRQIPSKAIVIQDDTAGILKKKLSDLSRPARLIVTSPPYPGIHVLYHRWQVDGRRETPAPFWIANSHDGHSTSHYTMGDRNEAGQNKYYANLKKAFHALARIADFNTIFVQMVAFSQPEWQLQKYLNAMEECGLKEYKPWSKMLATKDGRLWREVPSRRWHATQKDHSPSAHEVVLVHKKNRISAAIP